MDHRSDSLVIGGGVIGAATAFWRSLRLSGPEIGSTGQGGHRSWVVSTNRGAFEAAEVVVCAGPLAHRLLSPFSVDLPRRINPRYRALIPDPPSGPEPEEIDAPLVINIRNGAYWRPAPGGVWLSIANVDDTSVEPRDNIVVPAGFVPSCAAEIEPVSPRLAARARAAAASGTAVVGGGYQAYPADDLPFVGAVPGWPNLYANYGHWAGIMLAPASARLLTDLIRGVVDDGDNPCRLSRFDGGDRQQLLGARSTNKFGGWG